MRFAARFGLLFAAVGCASCGQPTGGPPITVEVSDAAPIEAQLAALEARAERVSRTLVAAFDDVLTALEIRCTETRRTSPGLADIARQSVAAAVRNGRTLSLLDALRTLESSIHEGADMKIDCTEAARRLFWAS